MAGRGWRNLYTAPQYDSRHSEMAVTMAKLDQEVDLVGREKGPAGITIYPGGEWGENSFENSARSRVPRLRINTFLGMPQIPGVTLWDPVARPSEAADCGGPRSWKRVLRLRGTRSPNIARDLPFCNPSDIILQRQGDGGNVGGQAKPRVAWGRTPSVLGYPWMERLMRGRANNRPM